MTRTEQALLKKTHDTLEKLTETLLEGLEDEWEDIDAFEDANYSLLRLQEAQQALYDRLES